MTSEDLRSVDPGPIDLDHDGVQHLRWIDVVRSLPAFEPANFTRLVVVAPHPDDETLGVGGLIAATSARGGEVLVIALTDGEAAYPRADLGTLRHGELRVALGHLGLAKPVDLLRLQLPDGGLAACQQEIASRLASVVRAGDLVVGPLDCDGHPDHDAAGAAVLTLRPDPTVDIALYPIWAWHWHDPERSVIASNGRRFHLTKSTLTAKHAAIDAYVSQTAVPDRSPTGQAVLPEHFLRRFDQPFEVLIPR